MSLRDLEEDCALRNFLQEAILGFFDPTKDCGLPVERVVAYRPCAALTGRVITDVLQFFVDSFQGHGLQISSH